MFRLCHHLHIFDVPFNHYTESYCFRNRWYSENILPSNIGTCWSESVIWSLHFCLVQFGNKKNHHEDNLKENNSSYSTKLSINNWHLLVWIRSNGDKGLSTIIENIRKMCFLINTPVSQTRWDPRPTGKISPKFVPCERKPLKFRPLWEKWSITIPTVNFWSEFAVPTWFFGLKIMKINIPSYKIKRIIPTGIFVLNLSPLAMKFPPGQWYRLSLIHIWRCRRSTLCRSRWSPDH